jgi:hypothetical protein
LRQMPPFLTFICTIDSSVNTIGMALSEFMCSARNLIRLSFWSSVRGGIAISL